MTAKPPRFTKDDRARQPRGGYADAKATDEPGYLARRFAEIRAEQERDKAEARVKVRAIKGRNK